MTLETIQRRQFSDPDRAAVQESVARAVEKDPDRFIDHNSGRITGEHVERSKENAPKPGKDIEESRGRQDDYGL